MWACQRFVGIRVGWLTMTALKHFKVELSVWCLQTVQTRCLDIITAAWHAVKQASTCHTSLPARKGEVRRVSSLFQIWIEWLNARVGAACRGLCCSPRSTETAPPSGSSRSTARIAPVKVGWDLKLQVKTELHWWFLRHIASVSINITINTPATLTSFEHFRIEGN